MSTAGKVLSVVVVLLAIIWVLLSATVAQLNRNWTQKLQQNQTSMNKIEEELAAADRSLVTLKDQTSLQQHATDNDMAVLEARIADMEKGRSQVIESASRVKLQYEGMDATSKAAIADHEQRKADLAAENQAKADLEASVKAMTTENAALLAQLTNLRDKFKTSLKANRQKAGLPALHIGQ